MCRRLTYSISFILALGLTGSVVQAQDNPFITLEAYDLPGYFVTHVGTGGPVAVLTEGGDQTDAGKFYLVPGLANPEGVSFESVEFPGYYLRHRDWVVRLESGTTDLFYNDATWTLRPGLADPEAVSFESTAAFVGNYLIHDPTSPYGLRMGPVATEGAATWRIADNPKASNPQPADGALYPDVWISLTWSSGAFAESHDVYFGDNFADVEAGTGDTFWGNHPSAFFVVGFPGYPYPEGLVRGTTYYWRVDEVNDLHPDSPWKGDVWSFTVSPRQAYGPTPADGAKFIDTNVTLSWTAGFGAAFHTVYFGDDFDTVNNATGGTGLPFTTYTPDPLELEKTYYWRVDETDAVTTRKGDVWSFTTMPIIPITDPNLVGWWKFDEGEGTNALDWSGHNNHGTLIGGPQWVAGYDGGALKLDGINDYVTLPIGSVISSLTNSTFTTWVDFSNTGGAWQRIFDFGNNTTVYMFLTPRLGTTGEMRFGITTGGGGDPEQIATAPSTLASGWHHVALTINADADTILLYLDGAVVASNTAATLTPSDLGNTTNNWLGRSQWAADAYFNGLLDDFRIYDYAMPADEIPKTMRGDPLLAWDPRPADESTPDVAEATPLSWSPGDKAAQHDVYFGTDEDAVDNADTSTPDIYRGRQSAASYTPPEGVEWGGGPHYWRIDEYNTDGTISKGRVWRFTVADYLVVDDIEGYDTDDAIWANWIDGLGYVTADGVTHAGNGTGSEVGDSTTATYTEEGIVHGGGQSMPYWYNNNKPDKSKYSEAKKTLSGAIRNWTQEGVKGLSLWFYGDPANSPEQMYVAVANSTGAPAVVPYGGDTDDLQKGTWQEWNIDLREFSGVNLTDVNSIAIGFGNRDNPQIGGSGKMYFDDIRLYRPRCVPSLLKPDADLSGNCIVDYADLEIIADNWLGSGYEVTPTDPGAAGLVAYYGLENNTQDGSGNSHHGTAQGAPTYVSGPAGYGTAMSFDGTVQGNYVDLGTFDPSAATGQLSIAMWAKWYGLSGFYQGLIGKRDAWTADDTMWCLEIEVNTAELRFFQYDSWPDHGFNVLPIGEWQHVAVSFNGTTVAMYIDGKPVGGSPAFSFGPRTDGIVVFGACEAIGGNPFNGALDEVRLYDRALSGTEVAWLAGKTEPFTEPFDMNKDDTVDFKDFAIIADQWLEQLF
ncbi:MAG: AbfB domain-containing protein, partial [Phycisphaerales bacterium]